MARRAKLSYTERTRNGGYRATVTIRGKRVKGKTHFGPDAHRQAHEDALQLLDRREGPTEPVTIEEALARVLARLKEDEARAATVKFYESHIGWWIRELGAASRLDEITHDQVQGIVDQMRKQASPLTIRHRLAALTRACNVCGIPNPADRKRLRLPRQKHKDPGQRLSWDEVLEMLGALVEAGQQIPLAVLVFVAGTGVRRTEFARMRRKDMDLAGNRFVISVGKARPRELPLPDSAVGFGQALLDMTEGGKAGFLLPGDSERQRINFLVSCVNVARSVMGGDKRIKLHELRKAFGSRVAQSYPVPVTAALLGRALPGVTGLYVSADWKTLKEAMETVWADLDGAL